MVRFSELDDSALEIAASGRHPYAFIATLRLSPLSDPALGIDASCRHPNAFIPIRDGGKIAFELFSRRERMYFVALFLLKPLTRVRVPHGVHAPAINLLPGTSYIFVLQDPRRLLTYRTLFRYHNLARHPRTCRCLRWMAAR